MARNSNDGINDRPSDERERREALREPASDGPDEYEITAKDAGWLTPTLLVSPAEFVYFDPPRPIKRP